MSEFEGYSFSLNNSLKSDTHENVSSSVSKSFLNGQRYSSLDYYFDVDIEAKKFWSTDSTYSSENMRILGPPSFRETSKRSIPKKSNYSKKIEDLFVFSNFSQQSVLYAMDQFVKSVINMQSVVLIPSKLKDMDVDATQRKVKFKDLKQIKQIRDANYYHCFHRHAVCSLSKPSILANSDLFTFYNMLNEMKKELLWGNGNISSLTNVSCNFENNQTALSNIQRTCCQINNKHNRPSSLVSLGSLGLTPSTMSILSTSNNSDQETDDSETDSLLTDRDSIGEHTSRLAASLRYHSQGLYSILKQLTDATDYISLRYQQELDTSS